MVHSCWMVSDMSGNALWEMKNTPVRSWKSTEGMHHRFRIELEFCKGSILSVRKIQEYKRGSVRP